MPFSDSEQQLKYGDIAKGEFLVEDMSALSLIVLKTSVFHKVVHRFHWAAVELHTRPH